MGYNPPYHPSIFPLSHSHYPTILTHPTITPTNSLFPLSHYLTPTLSQFLICFWFSIHFVNVLILFLLWAVVEDIMCRDFSRTQPSCGELEIYSCQLNFSGQSPLPFKYVLLLLCFLSWMILHWFSDHPLFLKIFYKILWTVVCLLLHCKAKILNSGIKYKHKITITFLT